MTAPRRAAVADEADAHGAAVDEAAIDELGAIEARRAFQPPAARPRRWLRLVSAPLAVLSVSGLAVGLLVLPPTGEPLTEGSLTTEPLGISRSQERAALTPSPEASQTHPPAAESIDTSEAARIDAELFPATASGTPEPAAPESAAEPAEAPAAPAEPAASPSEPSAAPTSEAPPPFDPSVLGEAAGTRYSTDSVNVRTGPGTGYDVRTAIADGAEVTITDVEVDGWRQVTMSKRAGWIKASFLTETKPAPKPQATPTASSSASSSSSASGSSSSSSGSSGFSTAACTKASGIESGLTERTRGVLRAVCAAFPNVSSYGGARSGGGYHGSGQAIDVMISGSAGWEIANWARANASALGIIEVIYEQQIWTSQRSGDGWRGMSDRGSVSANHYDHVHLSVR